MLPDWIDSYTEFTDELPSPRIFRQWAGISAVAGALERRVWVRSSGGLLYPNLYVLLVAPPAIGKSQAIAPMLEMMKDTKELHIAPDDVSKASLLDALEDAKCFKVLNKVDMLEYHSLQVAASEFGVLVPSHDLAFLNTLNHIFDNPASYKEKKRTTKKDSSIIAPQINLIAGTQPAYMAELLPEAAWGMGFTSRLILVYCGQQVQNDIFTFRTINNALRSKLVSDLTSMTSLYGEMRWTQEAMDHVVGWYKNGAKPTPDHSKLEHYRGRRILHLLKLCAIASVSRGSHMYIELEDTQRALNWLLEIEVFMPDIFRAMVGRSDIDILEELHTVVWQLNTSSGKEVHRSRVYAFLQTKVPAEKIIRILETAVASGILKETLPGASSATGYLPGTKPARIVQ